MGQVRPPLSPTRALQTFSPSEGGAAALTSIAFQIAKTAVKNPLFKNISERPPFFAAGALLQ
jgi:hypothetical protein